MLWPTPEEDTGSSIAADTDTDGTADGVEDIVEAPDPMEVMRETVEALRLGKPAPEGAAAAIATLAPERAAEVTGFTLLRADRPMEQVVAGLAAVPDGGVALFDGRYVLKDSVVLEKRNDIALVGLPGTEVFVKSGRAVLSVKESRGVVVHGLYMNHYATEVPYFKWGDCVDLNPSLRRSHVVLATDSQLALHRAELPGLWIRGYRSQ